MTTKLSRVTSEHQNSLNENDRLRAQLKEVWSANEQLEDKIKQLEV